MRLSLVLLFACVLATLGACSPRIGDSCASSTNCSINGDRACDITQPGGSCVIFDCQADQCPDNGVCARFNPTEPRLQVIACMRRCGSDGDCRAGEGYRCVDPATFEDGMFAEVIDRDRPDGRFCAAVAATTP